MSRATTKCLSVVVALVSCSSGSAPVRSAGPVQAAPAEPAPESEPATQGPEPSDAPPEPVESRAEKTEKQAEPPPPEPSACLEGMQLVEGEYCTKVEQKCLESWFDESNKKKVCERFEAPSKCVGDKVKKRYCIDTYEYPNRKGERPEVMNNFYQAQVLCAAQGKRICTETEWTFACEGPEMKPFPHGYVRDSKKCRGDQKYGFPNMRKVAKRDAEELERLWQGVPSGTQPECVSDFGVADLPGNADELASSETFTGWRDKYDNVTTGGPWYLGVRNQCRPKIYTHDEGFYYYYLSFRCCAEPDGAETDPRAPKQIRRKWKFDRVERLARMTVAEARELQKKSAGKAKQKAAATEK